jgi:cell division protein FtsB
VWKTRPKLFILTLFGCLLLAVLLSGDYNLASLWGLQRQRRDLAREVDSLRMENQLLSDQIKRLESDPGAIEKVAREEFGMARRGETVYRVLPEGGDTTRDTTSVQPDVPSGVNK